jgi:hypothetical protein
MTNLNQYSQSSVISDIGVNVHTTDVVQAVVPKSYLLIGDNVNVLAVGTQGVSSKVIFVDLASKFVCNDCTDDIVIPE